MKTLHQKENPSLSTDIDTFREESSSLYHFLPLVVLEKLVDSLQ